MLPTKNRLAKEWAINRVRRRGRRHKTRYFQIFVLSQKRIRESRFAFVVSVKCSKKATKRNLLKRRARNLISNLLPQTKTGYDFVISFFPEAKNLSAKDLGTEIERSLKKRHYLIAK